MGIFYTQGEKKTRPGLYNRYENTGGGALAGAENGVVAALFHGNWGPINTVQVIESDTDGIFLYGDESAEIINLAFAGGASKVLAVRIGSGGTKGTALLKDTSGTPLDAITVTAKHEGDRAFGFIIRDVLGDAASREFALTEDGVIIEKLTFAVSADDEVDALIAASANSNFIAMEKKSGYAGTGKLALVASGTITPGTNPTVTTQGYSDGMGAIESRAWNCVIVDTDDTAVHAVTSGFVNRMFLLGKMGFATIGEPSTVAFATRCDHAKAYNDFNTIYVGMGYTDAAGEKYEGWKSAAYIAGMVAGIPSNKSITHKVIQGAVTPTEVVTYSQYEAAIKSGMIALSMSPSGQVWVDSGITTLVTPSGDDDQGWSKIKRCKIRFEIMTRISDTVEPLSGNIDNDDDGKATVLQMAQGVINEMIAEKKLYAGATIEIDKVANATADPDSSYFVIRADDIDALEKLYLVYKYRFNTNA